MEKGNISVNTENLMPIIKKWLYSDKDIFLREMVSNGNDAVIKLKKLIALGKASIEDGEELCVEVVLDKKAKTIKICDNGLGMTHDEVVNYITSVAFSGAQDFVDKYKDEDKEESRIIGHFGLGFYSAFMVSERVDINTLSYEEGAKSVFWTSDGGSEYEISEGTRTTRGTDIILHIPKEEKELLDKETLTSILNKYCAFFPTPIYLYEEGQEQGKCVNDTTPLWLKKPSECTEEEYLEFYHKVFNDFSDPLFYIHLNVDYPFNLKGILYFPKMKHEFEPTEGKIKLYANQVFVADNVKEIIPEFLLLLKGCVDCPDLPLNVSRSFLQNDGYAQKVSTHITKKVADKLKSIYKNKREDYNKYWDDIAPFVKFGCLKDEKFYDKVKDIVVYKTTDNRYISIEDYLENAKAHSHENEIFYVSDPLQQAQYIDLYKAQGIEAVILPTMIDTAFISFIESKNTGVKFKRIDSSIASSLKDGENENAALTELFKESIGDEKLKIETVSLKESDVPAVLLLSEETRRLRDMAYVYGNMGMPVDMFKAETTLSVNLSSPLIETLVKNMDNRDTAKTICKQIYDIARLAQSPLDSAALSEFIKRSNDIMKLAMEGTK